MTAFALFKYLHLLLISLWVGGQLFLPLVILPVLKNSSDRENIIIKAGIRFRKVGHVVLAMIIITGLAMYYVKMGSFSTLFQTAYGKTVLTKLILFVLMWLANNYHEKYMLNAIEKDDFSYKNIKLRAKISGYVTFLLSLILVWFGVMLSTGMF
tara:strand:+ start:83806 stop:84267 length:462 start_codon:yes stop_codon:yes gene_type:complete